MSTPTFTIDGEEYELTERVQEFFINQLDSGPNDNAYFTDTGELVHEHVRNGEVVEEIVVDVVEIFETYPEQARKTLANIGFSDMDVEIEGSGSLIDLRDMK